MSAKKKKRQNGTSQAAVAAMADRFARAYIAKGENATQAYLEVKPHVARTTAGVEGHKLLKLPRVQRAIAQMRAQLRKRFDLTTERVVHETARIAYFNPRRVLDEKGKPRKLHELDEDTAAGLHFEIAPGKNGQLRVERVRMARPSEKNAANEKLIKMLRLYDKPPPPPPPDPQAKGPTVDERETVRRLAFLLAKEEAATREVKPAPVPASEAKKKAPATA